MRRFYLTSMETDIVVAFFVDFFAPEIGKSKQNQPSRSHQPLSGLHLALIDTSICRKVQLQVKMRQNLEFWPFFLTLSLTIVACEKKGKFQMKG